MTRGAAGRGARPRNRAGPTAYKVVGRADRNRQGGDGRRPVVKEAAAVRRDPVTPKSERGGQHAHVADGGRVEGADQSAVPTTVHEAGARGGRRDGPRARRIRRERPAVHRRIDRRVVHLEGAKGSTRQPEHLCLEDLGGLVHDEKRAAREAPHVGQSVGREAPRALRRRGEGVCGPVETPAVDGKEA